MNGLYNSLFVRQVTRLAGGTAFAQIINIFSLPFLTRLYSPADFGIFTVFLASVAILTSISTLKYENSILNASLNGEARDATLLTIYSSCIVTIPLSLLAIVSFLFSITYFGMNWTSIIYLILAVGFSNIFTALYFWCNRVQKYAIMTNGRVYASLSVAIVSLVCGYFFQSINGLIVGSVVGMAINAMYLVIKLKPSFQRIRVLKARSVFQLALMLKRFPIYLVPSTLLDRAASQIHIFVFLSVFGSATAGAMGVYNRVVGLPTSIIGNAVSDVFKRKVSDLMKEKKCCKSLFLITFLSLFVLALPASLILHFFAPSLFVIILGEEWGQAGEIASFLAVNFLFGFVVSPLAGILYLEDNQKYDLLIQMFLVFILSFGMWFAINAQSFSMALTVYAVSFIIKYSLQLCISYRIAIKRRF